MKWSSRSLALICLLMLAFGLVTREEALAASKRKPASQNVSLDDIELDDVDDIQLDGDEAPAKPTKKPAKKIKAAAATAPKVIDDDVKKAVADAVKAEKAKKPDEVVKLLKDKLDRLDRKGLFLLARAYRAQESYQNEYHVLEQIYSANAQDYVVKTQLADSLLKQKKAEEAIVAYREAKAINKEYKPAYDGLWKALELSKDSYEARLALHDMVKTFGSEKKSSAELCRLYSAENFLEKAIELCRSAIETDPENPDNYVHLGMSLRDEEKPDEASEILSKAAKRFPASEWVQSAAGDMRIAKKDYAQAYVLYKAGAKADAKSARSWAGLAKSAHELQKYEEALNAFKISCKLDRKQSIQIRAAATDLGKSKNSEWQDKYAEAAFNCDN